MKRKRLRLVSEKQKSQSDEGYGGQKADSVFEFLYYDSKRIGSFLSQFDNFGHLKELIDGEVATRGSSSSTSGSVSGGVPAVLSGSAQQILDGSKSHKRESQRVYDPFWTNALSFLDYLTEKSLIQREIDEAGIGQFVLVPGILEITDHKFMKQAWELSAVQSLIKKGAHEASGNRHQRRAKRKNGQQEPPASDLDLFLELITIMPHNVQAIISGKNDVWCSLDDNYLSTSASDLVLKHGARMDGTWHLLGILDAKPKTKSEISSDMVDSDRSEEIEGGNAIVANLYATIAPVTRQFLGRPNTHFGVTPLLVFREIS